MFRLLRLYYDCVIEIAMCAWSVVFVVVWLGVVSRVFSSIWVDIILIKNQPTFGVTLPIIAQKPTIK